MMDIDRFSHLLEQQAAQLPSQVYQGLNLGVGVAPGAKRERRAPQGMPAYILGEYRVHPVMGRGVLLYYGSFMAVYPHLREEELVVEVDRVLKHELTHHLEHMAGSRDLEIADAKRLMDWHREDGA